jgi:hypothetical protein
MTLFEKQGLLLPERTSEQTDAEIATSFDSAHEGMGAFYAQLTLKADQKERVLAALHEGQDADLTPNHLDTQSLSDTVARLKQWKADLLHKDIAPDIKQAYRWKINEDIANAYMILAAEKGDMAAFERWNTFIYGEADEDLYRGAIDWVANDADKLADDATQTEDVHDAAIAVQSALEGMRGYREILLPESETFDAVRADHFKKETGFYALLLAGIDIPESGRVTRATGHGMVQQMLTNIDSGYGIKDAAGTAWGVLHRQEMVSEPKQYDMTWERFIGLPGGHEVATHIGEAVNGKRGPLGIARIGLDRAEQGGEGRALIREQVVYENVQQFTELPRWKDILLRTIAIDYACGVGEETTHTASEVYALISAIETMYQLSANPDDPQAALKKAETRTDTLVLRVLKGTDGTGGAYRKDDVYLKGNVASWLTADVYGPESVSLGDVGKYDISNPRHIAFLQNHGLLPQPE